MSDLDVKAQNASAVIPAAELHGMVCGFAAGDPEQFSLTDFVRLAGADALSDESSVSEFVDSSLAALFSQDLGFSPLIADDSEQLSTRLAGLAEWCAGFLSGFGASVSERMTLDVLPVDVQEILRDFASISGLQEDVQGDEQDENSFMEIYEYVRVAVVLTTALMSGAGDAEATDAGEDRH